MGKTSAYKINMGYEDEMTLEGYKWVLRKAAIGWIVIILSAGVPLILASWKRSILLKLTHVLCHPDEAQKVLLKDKYSQEFIESVFQSSRPLKDGCSYCYFFNKRIKYIWKKDLQRFVKLDGLEVDSCQDLLTMSSGLSDSDVDYQQSLFGENSLLIEMTPVYKLVINEVFSPFYVYQLFIVIVWMVQLYYQFGVCVILLSIISVSVSVWQTRKQTRALKEAVHTESPVTVLRDSNEVTLSSKQLVPGDVIILPESHHIMECDAVLINGDCIVNESMLTGESFPITKVPVSAEDGYTCSANKRNTLFCGTSVLHSRSTNGRVAAIVYRTGFNTMKGELVRSILFPKPVHFKLHADVMKSMVIFLILGIPAMIYTGIIFSSLGAFARDIAIIVIDVATFVVPPLLPAVLTSLNASAQRRLKKNDIYCLNSRYINFCGALSVVCFDKTGTLTEDCLDIAAVVPCENAMLQPVVNNLKILPHGPMLVALATCHSLHLIRGEVVGYEMDIKTLQTIDWKLEEPKLGEPVPFDKIPARIVMPRNVRLSSPSLGIVRQFPFESQLQRATVVVTAASSNLFHVYCKGAPEIVQTLCLPATVPENFREALESYTRHGLRVLAVASKALPNDTTWDQALHLLPRAELEYDLHFRGFIVLQNKLKPESISTITALEDALIKTVMVTGDNLLTAVAVARDCNMIKEADAVIQVEAEAAQHGTIRAVYNYIKLPGLSEKIPLSYKASADDIAVPLLSDCSYHLAVDGRTFNLIRLHDKLLFEKLVHKGKVFARMLPEQKLQLIEALQDIGHQVGMCGDGANDCGALKAAHAGVSLSVAEASVASPFTAQRQNIECMIDVIREGRATLAATFGAFRYMVSYCFVLLVGALFLFWDGQKPSEGAYVFIDVFISLVPPMIFGTTGPYPALTRRAPAKSISNVVSIFSILSFIVIQTGFHTVAYVFCIQQPWYTPFVFDKNLVHTPPQSYVATAVLSVNCMSYVIAAVIFSPGPPFRKSIISNKLYLAVVVVEFAVVSYVILYPAEFVRNYINFKEAPQYEFHAFLFVLSLLNFIFSYIWEVFLVQQFLVNVVMPQLHHWRGPRQLHEKLERDLIHDPTWPPVNTAASIEDRPPSSPDHDSSSAALLNLPTREKQTSKLKFQSEETHEMSVVGRPTLSFSTFRGSSKKRKNEAARCD
ncbi:hypothetical protein V5799_010458 [Amblyomma americanum]|uniref:Cation-transporting ATPase n=1 Tax=Amblyomma americanum TaxID=6943 RepID=A0AAQ4EK49_AMBAM